MACVVEYLNAPSEFANKGNEFAVEGLKQILTVAAALLVLSISFLKDVLGENHLHEKCFALIPMGWGFLAVSLWCGWVAIPDAARKIGTGKIKGYAFEAGLPRLLAKVAQWTFFCGLMFLAAFAIINFEAPAKRSNAPGGGHGLKSKASVTNIDSSLAPEGCEQ